VERLKKTGDFKKIYARGRSIADQHLVLYYYPNHLKDNRVGFSISKKLGKAVIRNKIKRRLKEIIRLNCNLSKGYDLIFVARRSVISLDYFKLQKTVINLFKKAGIWQEQV
jgi:ribonuclease P protein component